MGKETGILLDVDSNDLLIQVKRRGKIVSGMVVGNVTQQNQSLLLQLHPGELKGKPSVGVGISDMLLDNADFQYWRSKVRQSFEKDGMTIKTFVFDKPNEMLIDADYNQ